MMNIQNCANCNKEINLDVDAQTSCSTCKKDFCFAWNSSCFSEYHSKNNLYEGHKAFSISNPAWKINIRCEKD